MDEELRLKCLWVAGRFLEQVGAWKGKTRPPGHPIYSFPQNPKGPHTLIAQLGCAEPLGQRPTPSGPLIL